MRKEKDDDDDDDAENDDAGDIRYEFQRGFVRCAFFFSRFLRGQYQPKLCHNFDRDVRFGRRHRAQTRKRILVRATDLKLVGKTRRVE